MPETQMMSPAVASSTSMRSRPRNDSSFVSRRPFSTLPSCATLAIGALTLRGAAEDAADADAPDVFVVVDRADEHLEGAVFGRRFRNVLGDRFEERLEACRSRPRGCTSRCRRGRSRRSTGKSACSSLAPSSMKRSKTSFIDFARARVLAVDLVDDDDRAQVEFERLAQHEARLRHHAFGGIDQQQHALHHLQHALDLTAEIGVARRVDDVELDAVVLDRRVLRQDRDATFLFERIRVHGSRFGVLAFAIEPALTEHRIDESRLAVVDVGDDREITDVLTGVHNALLYHFPALWPRSRGRYLPKRRCRCAYEASASLKGASVECRPRHRRGPQFRVGALIEKEI